MESPNVRETATAENNFEQLVRQHVADINNTAENDFEPLILQYVAENICKSFERCKRYNECQRRKRGLKKKADDLTSSFIELAESILNEQKQIKKSLSISQISSDEHKIKLNDLTLDLSYEAVSFVQDVITLDEENTILETASERIEKELESIKNDVDKCLEMYGVECVPFVKTERESLYKRIMNNARVKRILSSIPIFKDKRNRSLFAV